MTEFKLMVGAKPDKLPLLLQARSKFANGRLSKEEYLKILNEHCLFATLEEEEL